MIETIKNAFKIKEIRNKIFMTFLLVLIYRIGCYIPIPGIDRAVFESTVAGNDFFSIMSAITGGALSQGTLLALGISPYINAQIIMQLLTVAIPGLERLSKEGEEGRKKIGRITRWMTLGIAIITSCPRRQGQFPAAPEGLHPSDPAPCPSRRCSRAPSCRFPRPAGSVGSGCGSRPWYP